MVLMPSCGNFHWFLGIIFNSYRVAKANDDKFRSKQCSVIKKSMLFFEAIKKDPRERNCADEKYKSFCSKRRDPYATHGEVIGAGAGSVGAGAGAGAGAGSDVVGAGAGSVEVVVGGGV